MHPLASSTRGLRILVADDYPDSGESLQILLRLWGHEVLVTHSGREALAVVQAFRPHMVLLDFQMPGLNGGEVAQQMRQLPDFERLVIVAATGHDHDEESFQPYLKFFNHHLRKPFNLGELEKLLAFHTSVEEPGSSSGGTGT